MTLCLISDSDQKFVSFLRSPHRLWVTGYQDIYPLVKRPGIEANHLLGQKIKVRLPLFHRLYLQNVSCLTTNTPLPSILMAMVFIANAFL